MKKHLKNLIHPILLSIYPVIYLYAENPGEVTFSALYTPTAYLLIISITLLVSTFLLVRDFSKTAILVSAFLIIFLSYRPLYDAITINIWGIKQINFMISCVLIYFIIVFFVIKSKRNFSNLTVFLNVIAVSLILIPIFQNFISLNLLNRPDKRHNTKENNEFIYTNPEPANKDTNLRRDIYYLIFDQYGRDDILKKDYDFDNSMFINFLKERGFYVASRSYANYPHTIHSLASSLNMEYINYLGKQAGEYKRFPRSLLISLKEYKVYVFLNSKGYKYIHFGASWIPTSKNQYADKNYNIFTIESIEKILVHLIYRNTLLWAFLDKFHLNNNLEDDPVSGIRSIKKERIIYSFNKLSQVPSIKQPTYVFLHMLVPHPPFVFDEDGNFVNLEDERKNSRKTNYINQLQYTNKKIMELIDTILTESKTKPIIIIQSDEGPYPKGYGYKVENPERFKISDMRHKFAILNAFYLPDTDKSLLYPSITPVNTFRLVFNLYFGTDYDLLPDKHYMTNYLYPYRFIDVTDKIKEN